MGGFKFTKQRDEHILLCMRLNKMSAVDIAYMRERLAQPQVSNHSDAALAEALTIMSGNMTLADEANATAALMEEAGQNAFAASILRKCANAITQIESSPFLRYDGKPANMIDAFNGDAPMPSPIPDCERKEYALLDAETVAWLKAPNSKGGITTCTRHRGHGFTSDCSICAKIAANRKADYGSSK